ncbi:MAG: GAF domain-containing protein [Caldilineaceae bacterium]|nr:GAF domain-containing protein [Caldilineaceae bacterium]
MSLASFRQLDEAALHRQNDSQQALLRLAIQAGQYTQKLPLLLEAGRLAAALTGAAAGMVYLRTEADPGSQQLGESAHYQPYTCYLSPTPNAFMPRLASVALSQIEQASLGGEIVQLEGNQRLLVPLRRHRKVMAMLELCSTPDVPFDATDVQVMTDLVLLLDSILKNQYLLAARTALTELAQDLSAELDLAILLNKVASAAASIATAQSSSILLLQPDAESLRFAAAYGLSESDRELLRQLSVPLQGSIAGSVVLTRQPLVNNNVRQNAHFYPGISESVSLKTRSLIAVPLIAQDQVIGALEVVNQQYDDEFDSEDVSTLLLFASQAAIAIQNARLLGERQSSLTELRKLEQRKSQFIALVSHELRTPLNLVSGYAMLLRDSLEQRDPPTDLETMERLEQIERATGQLVKMVNNITSMYNLETGRTQLVLSQKDVTEIVDKVLSEHREWALTKGLVITFEPACRPLYVTCDAIEIHRILDNLINNAIKFTPEGGRITLWATLLAEKRMVQIAISDTGPGIDPSQMETIFERFAQLDNHLNRAQDGMGLGLPLAQSLVQKHGGELWVNTALGQGSTFFFTLPTAEAEEEGKK